MRPCGPTEGKSPTFSQESGPDPWARHLVGGASPSQCHSPGPVSETRSLGGGRLASESFHVPHPRPLPRGNTPQQGLHCDPTELDMGPIYF